METKDDLHRIRTSPSQRSETADLGPACWFIVSRRALAPVAACGEATKPGLAPTGSLNQRPRSGWEGRQSSLPGMVGRGRSTLKRCGRASPAMLSRAAPPQTAFREGEVGGAQREVSKKDDRHSLWQWMMENE